MINDIKSMVRERDIMRRDILEMISNFEKKYDCLIDMSLYHENIDCGYVEFVSVPEIKINIIL